MLEYERKNFIENYNVIETLYNHDIINNHEAAALKERLLLNIVKRLMQEGRENED